MQKNDIHKLSLNQKGLVSFMVTMILMLVISLIVVGFTQLVIRNRQDALDKQLSTQALYAAETGVNDVLKVLRTLYAADPNSTPPTKSTCNEASAYDPVAPASKTLSAGVSYTCVLVTPNATQIRTSAGVKSSNVITIDPVKSDGTNSGLWSLTFDWKRSVDEPVSSCLPANAAFPKNWGTCPYGILRVDFFDTKLAASNTADAYRDATFTTYLVPTNSNGNWNLLDLSNRATDRASRINANCTDTSCRAQIDTHDDPTLGPYKFYVRLTSIYLDIENITVTGQLSDKDATTGAIGGFWGGSAYFRGQTRIDVTGKAQDVLRRIQVQVSPENFDSTLIPNAAVHSSGDICKRFIAAPGYTENQCTL